MDLIRDSVFFTTVLHCVLAYSLPQNDGSAHKSGSYNIVSFPEIKTVQTPPKYEKILSVTPSFVNPSWHSRHSEDNSGLGQDVKSSQPLSYKSELPGTVLKGTGLKYLLTTPRVKLNFVGTSGMLPVKINQNAASIKPEPLNKVIKPNDLDFAKLDEKVKTVELHKNIQSPSSKPGHYIQQVMKTANDPPAYPSILYGQDNEPLNTPLFTPPYTPELPDIFLNPTNYPPTNPGVDYGKAQEALKSIQYTPSYKYELPSLGSRLNPSGMDDFTNLETNYGKIENQAKNTQYTSTYKPASGVVVLKPTNFDYPSTNPGLYYGKVNQPDKTNQFTPLYRTYVPEIISTKKGKHGSDLPVHKDNLPVGVLNFDYTPTKPSVVKENTGVIMLPPVPTTMSLLRRTQLALLNTIAGLPVGNSQALDSVRAS